MVHGDTPCGSFTYAFATVCQIPANDETRFANKRVHAGRRPKLVITLVNRGIWKWLVCIGARHTGIGWGLAGIAR
jgi:hypothetical protein